MLDFKIGDRVKCAVFPGEVWFGTVETIRGQNLLVLMEDLSIFEKHPGWLTEQKPGTLEWPNSYVTKVRYEETQATQFSKVRIFRKSKWL